MDDKAIRLLLIEDNEDHIFLIHKMLKEARKASFHVEIRKTLTKGLEFIAEEAIDVILLDLTLPDSIGLDTFGRIHAHAPDIPIIVVTTASDEAQALMAFQKGAQDCLIKSEMDIDLLERSIRYSIERNKVKAALRKSEERLEKINKCFLGFGDEPSQNIYRLTSLFGELLGATCALYNCLDDRGMLCSIGQWQTPKDYNPKDNPQGHICYDVITKGDKKSFLVRNLQETEYAKSDPNVKRYKLQTYLGYPIKWKDSIVGSLCAVYQKDFVPSEDDLKAVDIIAAAIEVEENRRRAEEGLRESEEMFRIIFESTTECITVWDKDYNYLYANQAAIDHVGATRDKVIGKNIQSGMGHIPEFMKLWMGRIDKVFQTQKPMKVEDSCLVGDRLIYSESVIAPLRNKNGDIFAVGVVYKDMTERKYAENELQKLNKELTRSNKRLNQLSVKDLHTGLYDHRYFAEIIGSEFYRVKKYGGSLSLIMIDVDYFKSINDMYSHKFGDLVLKQLAQQIRKMMRQYDIIIRYGGEEFVVILPGTDRDQAAALAQRILNAIGLYNFGDSKHTVKLKTTLSVVSCPKDRVSNGMDMIKVAEQILTRAKEEGGNRVYTSLDKTKIGRELKKYIKPSDIKALKQKLGRLHRQAKESITESIFAFAKTLELKDHYTGEHVERTVNYAVEIARALGLPSHEVEMIKEAATLHDLGKIGISEKILTKKSKLSKKEFEEIRKHPSIAADILRPIHVLNAIIPFILYHHERWDGKGYPAGLKGDEIPLGARIVAIADVYQALMSDRPYRKALARPNAIKIIEEGAGTQFDPRIVNMFLGILKKEKNK
ncbi:MAG: hypothetical protein A3I73_06470 [Omnitrophica bacterium RIFCSPLOWO2_02_FULL_45_16]|nr:MAG: hypothetical protein A3C51_02785 [Omnitrophica bacterium RIFCSPHIGHO2_02_FULL_46_20]OGW92951.1 MAG: hypothetical protein A3K16_06825 [Omnitrophica bacterium RIFCSPLOWO2_01_FULL_45_24]OGW93637.1 MAG: hypothetical protein A3G36_04260 [Omnitrophica bacterium RIFCSPLOWO2_12_FULL_45_13]OGW99786.1 MAG: hypothetical protein A3I73_06470 [Omnitrophica bacterium RIFCSPLOWO2_02_FULL_45_16]